MASPPALPAPTPATFRQLHVKFPTEHFREPSPNKTPSASAAWLDAHKSGFLLMHSLVTHAPIGKSVLLESLDTGELIVNKRLKRRAPRFERNDFFFTTPAFGDAFRTQVPGELRFSTLDDPRVDVRLPEEPYFPKLYGYGLPQGEEPSGGDDDVFSLYFKRYNGGSLENLMEMYSDGEIGAPVPEPFVWHVIEQLSRAVLFLHKGYSRAFVNACLVARRQDEKRWKGVWPALPREVKNWTAIVHRTIREGNVLLHFPEDGDPLSKCFPQVVLEGFDQANLENGAKEVWSEHATANRPGEAGRPAVWEDIHLMGQIFRKLVTIHDCRRNQRHNQLQYNVDIEGKMSAYETGKLKLAPGEEAAYSQDLINLLKSWEIPKLQNVAAAKFSDPDVHPSIPTYKFLEDEALPLASRKVEEFRGIGFDKLASEDQGGFVADVSWVMPDPEFEHVPYATQQETEEDLLAQLRYDFRWLYSPYIPVWYRYDAVEISVISQDAPEFYAPDDHVNPLDELADRSLPDMDTNEEFLAQLAQGRDDPTESESTEEDRDAKKRVSIELTSSEKYYQQFAGHGANENGEEDEDKGEKEEGDDEDEDEVEGDGEDAQLRKQALAANDQIQAAEDRILADADAVGEDQGSEGESTEQQQRREHARKVVLIWVAQDRFRERASQQPERLWVNPQPRPTRPRARKLNKFTENARSEYESVMALSTRIWERRIRLITTDDICGCANCIRGANRKRMGLMDLAHTSLAVDHNKTIDTIRKMPEFRGKRLTFPVFQPPFYDDDLLKPPLNPYDIESRVEEWAHVPFAEDYAETWTHDRFYPWRQFEYPGREATPEVKQEPAADESANDATTKDTANNDATTKDTAGKDTAAKDTAAKDTAAMYDPIQVPAPKLPALKLKATKTPAAKLPAIKLRTKATKTPEAKLPAIKLKIKATKTPAATTAPATDDTTTKPAATQPRRSGRTRRAPRRS